MVQNERKISGFQLKKGDCVIAVAEDTGVSIEASIPLKIPNILSK